MEARRQKGRIGAEYLNRQNNIILPRTLGRMIGSSKQVAKAGSGLAGFQGQKDMGGFLTLFLAALEVLNRHTRADQSVLAIHPFNRVHCNSFITCLHARSFKSCPSSAAVCETSPLVRRMRASIACPVLASNVATMGKRPLLPAQLTPCERAGVPKQFVISGAHADTSKSSVGNDSGYCGILHTTTIRPANVLWCTALGDYALVTVLSIL